MEAKSSRCFNFKLAEVCTDYSLKHFLCAYLPIKCRISYMHKITTVMKEISQIVFLDSFRKAALRFFYNFARVDRLLDPTVSVHFLNHTPLRTLRVISVPQLISRILIINS